MLLVFVSFSFPRVAHAKPTVEELSQKGAEAYQEKDFASAISFFKKAYEEEEVPNLLFNIAKCYEKQKDWDQAIEYYQKFVIAPDVEKEYRKAALEKIKKIEETKEAEEAQRLAKKDKDKEKTQKSTPDPKDNLPPKAVKAPDRSLAYIVGGTGLALIGGGVAIGLLAQGGETDFKTAESVEEKRNAQSSGRTFSLAANGMYIAGGIATLFGTYLLITADSDTDIPVRAWFTPKSGGASVHFSF